MTDLSVVGMFNKDLEISSQGVVASKLIKAVGLLLAVCEQEFIVRHNAPRPNEKNRLTFFIKYFSTKLETIVESKQRFTQVDRIS
jgi:hypothetical protein